MKQSDVQLPSQAGGAFEQAPLAIAHDRLPEHRQETAVELVQRRVGRLQRRADQVRRDALAAALELPLMEEAQARVTDT